MGTLQLRSVAPPALAVPLPFAATLLEHLAYDKRRRAPLHIKRRA
jgi:hypothetical protein